jgi:hypothetical protein
LETSAASIGTAEAKRDGTASRFFKTLLSSITPSVPLDFIIVYWEPDLGGSLECWCESKPVCSRHPPYLAESYKRWHGQQTRLIREMYSVRDFRLVLCADVLDCAVGDSVGRLVRIAEEAGEGLGHLYKPLIIAERRSHRVLAHSGKLYVRSGVDNYDSVL